VNDPHSPHRPLLTNAARPATFTVPSIDEHGVEGVTPIAGEHPLTLYVDKDEILTLMTLGAAPEALALGYLRNQRLVDSIDDVLAVQVDWDVDAVALPKDATLARSALYDLLDQVRTHETIYKQAGAVHGCALATNEGERSRILHFVEDVGRHNAVDAIAGLMWLDGQSGADKVFYTTGRLTSEMVIKSAQMGIPFLVSRSGLTQMGYEIARKVGMTMIGRATNRHYLLFTGAARFRAGA
jgi:FdhD protein